jgi:hypothetical protein
MRESRGCVAAGPPGSDGQPRRTKFRRLPTEKCTGRGLSWKVNTLDRRLGKIGAEQRPEQKDIASRSCAEAVVGSRKSLKAENRLESTDERTRMN